MIQVFGVHPDFVNYNDVSNIMQAARVELDVPVLNVLFIQFKYWGIVVWYTELNIWNVDCT